MYKKQLLIIILLSMVLGACEGRKTDEPAIATLSNDQLGTRAAQTAAHNFTPAVTILPSDTVEVITPEPSKTKTSTYIPTTIAPTLMPTADVFSVEGLTILDDFEDEAGWFIGSSDSYILEYLEGGYHFVVNMITGPSPVYSIRQILFTDIQVAVDVMRYSGDDGGYLGLVCRYTNPLNYYRFVIYTEGDYEIAKKVDGVFTSLARDEVPEKLMKANSADNIRALCVGNRLILVINNKTVVEVTDIELTSGYVGLIAGTDLDPALDVLFDNFQFSQP